MSLVLIADSAGTPKDWVDYKTAVCYYARLKVLWQVGSQIKVFNGGINSLGVQSRIAISSIVGVSGPIHGTKFYNKDSIWADRQSVYSRDRHLCAYCGNQFNSKELTIDHVVPKSKGGLNLWTNVVSSCKPCNHKKGNKTPEEANTQLLYIPYIPNLFEKMILKNKKILADQMEFLIGRIPKHSRIFPIQ